MMYDFEAATGIAQENVEEITRDREVVKLHINAVITSDEFSCGLKKGYRGGPFYGCSDGVGRWCQGCPCLRKKGQG